MGRQWGMTYAIALAVFAAACRCTTTPAPLPPDPVPVATDAGPPAPDASPYVRACFHLHELGCREGEASDCARVMSRADARHLTVVPTACIIAAGSQGAVRACGGFVRCAP